MISDALKLSDVPTTKQEEEKILNAIRDNKQLSGQVVSYLGNRTIPKADRAMLVAKKIEDWIKPLRTNAARAKLDRGDDDDDAGFFSSKNEKRVRPKTVGGQRGRSPMRRK